jgi:Tfp pilus assembly protein PilO
VKLAIGGRTLSGKVVVGLAAAAVALFAAAGWMLLVSPKRSQASDLDAQIAQVESELSIRAHGQSTAQNRLSKSDLQNLERALPDGTAMPAIVLQLSALAAQSGVTLNTITPAAPMSAGSYQALPMTVVVDGHFFGVRDFLRRVRTQVRVGDQSVKATGRLFDVQAVDLQQTEPAPQVRASLTMRAFVYGAAGSQPATPTTPSTESTGAGE